jgi:hypothetical protein
MTGSYVIKPIRYVEAGLVDPAVAPKQGFEGAPDAWLVFNPDVAQGLRDLTVGSNLFVLTWLHRAQRGACRPSTRRPAKPGDGRVQHAVQDRPNPMGLHRVGDMFLGERPLRNRRTNRQGRYVEGPRHVHSAVPRRRHLALRRRRQRAEKDRHYAGLFPWQRVCAGIRHRHRRRYGEVRPRTRHRQRTGWRCSRHDSVPVPRADRHRCHGAQDLRARVSFRCSGAEHNSHCWANHSTTSPERSWPPFAAADMHIRVGVIPRPRTGQRSRPSRSRYHS